MEPRANLELGVEGPLRGKGTVSGYGFFLWNRPHFVAEDWHLRLIVAPVYLRSELVRDRWPADGHAFGLGLNGGAFAYNHDEFRDGELRDTESFYGHGADATFSYYRHGKIADLLPVEAQLRLNPQYVTYARAGDTDSRFRLPADTAIYSGRLGLRVGGVPPELLPEVAIEFSLWYEPSYRQVADTYGLPERPEALRHFTQRAWGRLGGVLAISRTQTAQLFLTAGVTDRSDPLSAFRLGSALPFRREFPLVLHGYFVDEVFARRFWLVNAAYRFPLWPGSERVRLQLALDYARVEYLPGHTLPRRDLRGVGADLTIALTPRLTLILGYGYGWDAPRADAAGGHEINALIELKF